MGPSNRRGETYFDRWRRTLGKGGGLGGKGRTLSIFPGIEEKKIAVKDRISSWIASGISYRESSTIVWG